MLMGVHRHVQTQLEVTLVLVVLDIAYQQTTWNVMVKTITYKAIGILLL